MGGGRGGRVREGGGTGSYILFYISVYAPCLL